MKLGSFLTNISAHDDGLVFIDHREEEESIVGYVSDAIEGEGELGSEWRGDDLFVMYRGQSFRLPLTVSRHDRYVAISSLAKILESDYEIWIQKNSLDGDTHGLLIARKRELATLASSERTALEEHFVRLELGYDYFSGLKVPYLGNAEANPDLMKESAALKEQGDEILSQVMESTEMKSVIKNMRSQIGRLFRDALRKNK